jgi:hypothetical protein
MLFINVIYTAKGDLIVFHNTVILKLGWLRVIDNCFLAIDLGSGIYLILG